MSRGNGSAISRIWRAFGLKPHRIEDFKLSTDPQFVDKVRDVVGLYLNPPDAAVVDFFLKLFLQGDVPVEGREKLVRYQEQARQQKFPVYWTKEDAESHRVRAACHLVLTLPEFQLD